MGKLSIAFRAFLKALTDADAAGRIDAVLAGRPVIAQAPPPNGKAALTPAPPARSDALTLLAALQRESRLIDFLQEPISSYSDAQIGAAVREVHRGAGSVLQRAFALRPILAEPEGSTVELTGGADGGRVQLVGNVTGQPPFHGTVRHPGWEATAVDLPAWTGGDQAARVVAPAEVEL
jgi:hypothetical protein